MPNILVEVCCNTAEDVFRAKQGGAQRVELNNAIFLGGLTPSIGAVKTAKRAGIPIMAMVRPREGGFYYGAEEFSTMLADASALVQAGAEGIVFGVLTADGQVDVDRCKQMLEVMGTAQSVFHRAIDIVPNWKRALDDLISLGFTRVLTSGQCNNVLEGAQTVREMQEYAAGRIEINAGGGITLDNVQQVVQKTGCNQIHVSMRGTVNDPSMPTEGDVRFFGTKPPPVGAYSATDPDKLRRLMQMI